MAEPIRVDFQVGGIEHVLEAFRSVIQAQKDMESAINRAAAQQQKKAQASAGVQKKSAKDQSQAHAQGEKAETQVTQTESGKRDQVDAASTKRKKKNVAEEVAAHKAGEEQKTRITESESKKRANSASASTRRLNQLIAMHEFRAMTPEMQRASLERTIRGNELLKKRYGNNPRALSVTSAPYAIQEIAATRDWNALTKDQRNALRKSFRDSGQHIYLAEEVAKYRQDSRDVKSGERLTSRVQDKHFADENRARERAQRFVDRLRDRHFADEQRKREWSEAYVARLKERYFAQEQHKRESAEAYVARLKERYFADEQRKRERAEAYVARIKERYFADEQRKREAAERQSIRTQQAARRQFESSVKNNVSTYTGAAGQGFRSGVGGVLRAGGLVTSVLGGFSIADSIQNFADEESVATLIELNTKGAIKGKDIRARAADIGMRTGVKPLDILNAYKHFIELAGEEKGAKHQGLLDYLPQVHLATGVDLSHVAEMAGRMTAMGEFDDPQTLQNMLAMSVGVGRKGSVDIQHYAKLGGRLVGSTVNFADRKRAYRELLGIAQLAGRTSSATTASEVMISLPRLQSDIAKHSKDLISAGINPYEGNTNKLRPVSDILIDVVTNNSAAREKIQKIFNERGIRAVEPFMALYNDAVAEGKDPTTEIRKALAYFADDAMSTADIQADAARKLQDSSNRMAMALNQLREQIAQRLTPLLNDGLEKLQKLIPDLVKIVEAIAKVGAFIVENPKLSAAAYVGGSVATSVVSTALSQLVVSSLTRLFAAESMSAEIAAIAAANLTGLIAGAVGLVGAAIVAAATHYGIAKQTDEENTANNRTATVDKHVKDIRKRAKEIGGEKSSRAEELRQEIQDAKANIKELISKEQLASEDVGFAPMRALATVTGYGDEYLDSKDAMRTPHLYAIKNLQQSLEQLNATLKDFNDDQDGKKNAPPLYTPLSPPPVNATLPWHAPLRPNP